jgi:hypothetical protein
MVLGLVYRAATLVTRVVGRMTVELPVARVGWVLERLIPTVVGLEEMRTNG